MKRLTIIGLLAVLLAQQTQAATLNATKIGQIFTTTPVTEVAFQALTQFRGQFTPVNLVVLTLNAILITKIGDGINALRVQMASPLPAAQSPAGWVDSETPPTVGAIVSDYYVSQGAFHGSSGAQVCAAWKAGYFNYPQYTVYYEAGACKSTGCGGACIGVAVTSSCPAGYTLISSACTLTNSGAVQYPSDGQASVKPVGGVLTPNAHDPDNAGIVAGDISRTGMDGYNNPVKETVSANPSNGYDYKRDTQSVNPTTGEPTVQRDQFSVDANGNVTSVTSNTYNNSTVSSVNTTPAGQTDVSMLAKDATLAQTNTKLDDVKTLLAKDTAAYTEAPTTRTIAASLNLVIDKIKSKLPTVAFSDVDPDCPVFTKHIPFIDVDLTIDQFCTMDEFIRPTLQAVSLFLYALLAFFIIMRA